MTYKQALTDAMTNMAKDPKVVFVGYNVRHGSKANGTLINVPEPQLIETPVAESLMAGIAVGLSLQGFIPVVYFERFDFILNALDVIVNHLDKIRPLSDGQFNPKVIIRVVVGSMNAPLFTGPTHTQDFTQAMKSLVTFPVVPIIGRIANPVKAYSEAVRSRESSMLIEYRENYQVNVT